MSSGWIICALCGAQYSSSENPACGACPINEDCQLTCCPNCGYENVDVGRSALARLVARLLPVKNQDEAQTSELIRKRSAER